MEKNYYDWLEVSNKASSEVIEKAYKTLVKKYHPDLQEGQAKIEYEEILKHINEAYEVLSDPIKKESYDRTLKQNSFSEENYNNLYDENQKLKNEINNMNIKKQTEEYQKRVANNKNYDNFYDDTVSNDSNNTNASEYEQKINDAINQAYYDAYIQDLKNKGYRIKYKKTFKQYVKIFVSIVVLILILFILWQIPFIHNYFNSLYNENSAFKTIIDIFSRIFNAFKK